MSEYDFIVVGAGAAGLPCAIFGARVGARVLLVEKGSQIGGALHISAGRLSAAGTRRQRERGINDSTDSHFKDIQRISGGTVREDLVRLALAHSAWLSDWLQDQEFEFAPETPRIVDDHQPYSVPRIYYGVDEARSVLKVFAGLLPFYLESGAITLALDAPVKALLTDKRRVVGVQFVRDGKVEQARAKNGVVLATGGFAASPDLFKEIEGFPLVSAAPDHATGDGLRMATGVGAAIAGRGMYLPTFGPPHPDGPRQARWGERPDFMSPARPPYEIYVNRFGKRWVAEDEESLDLKERALLKCDDLTFFSVFDDVGIESSEPDLRDLAGHREGFHVAPTIEALAAAAGIDAFGLAATIERYNGFVRNQNDRDFGRRFLPAPIEKPPFFALRGHGIALVSFAGVDVDERLRVRGEEGDIIEGLYAAGEILGAAATCGHSFSGDMVLGPAIIFGKLLGEKLAIPEDVSRATTGEIPRPRF